eukprot:SAG31_NODE_1065_length_10096_cov_7.151530_11_plen_73_part_00
METAWQKTLYLLHRLMCPTTRDPRPCTHAQHVLVTALIRVWQTCRDIDCAPGVFHERIGDNDGNAIGHKVLL